MAQIHQTEKSHALLSASSSHRWLRCTPSARVEEGYADRDSEFAREGSLAHALAARKLKIRQGLPYFAETQEIKELGEYLTGEMEEYTDGYAEFVMNRLREAEEQTPAGKIPPRLYIEKTLDYSSWVKEGFGTGDAVIIGNDVLEVIDFKYGKGVAVEAEGNSQMMLYALGAADELDYIYPFERVRMTIYQPRIGNISSVEISARELTEWGEGIRPLSQLAWEGRGARMSGEWCRFCKAKGDCPRYAADTAASYLLHPEAERLTAQERADLLRLAAGIKDWLGAIEESSLKMALNGEEIPGFKVVEGRSVRKITDPAAVADKLKQIGATEREIYKEPELRSLSSLEAVFGKKAFKDLCGQYIEKPAGKPTLVPDGDRRDDITGKTDFDNIEL